MDKIIINKGNMSNLSIHSINNNSTIFIKGKELIKMPKIREDIKRSNLERMIITELDENVEYISSILGNHYILPKYSLYRSKVAPLNYKGYGMDFYEGYKTLSSTIESNEYSFQDRVYLCKSLCDAIIKLEKYKVAYWDLHTDNILINGKDIKICDMDSIVSSKVSGYIEYKKSLMWSYKHLSLLLLSILYSIDNVDFENIIKNNKDKRFIKDSKIFKRVIDKNYYMFYPDKYLDSFTEDYVENTKLILKR